MNQARSWAVAAGMGLLALGAGASIVVAACGGSTNASPGVDSGTNNPVQDSAIDVAVTDASDAGVDAPGDDAAGEDGGLDAASCPLDASATECRKCCAEALPAGYTAFETVELACACAGNLCGSPDASDDDAAVFEAGVDAAPYGTGACAATCAAPTSTPPDTTCQACISKTIGTSEADLGPCGDALVSQCLPNATCAPFLDCVLKCPGTK